MNTTKQSKAQTANHDILKIVNDFRPNDSQAAHEFFKAKMSFTTGPVELNSGIEKGADIVLIDVREKSAYDKAHVPGAISMPRDQWPSYENLSLDKLNVVYCYSHVCHLGARACAMFASEGYPVMELDGGFQAWEANGLETEGAASVAA